MRARLLTVFALAILSTQLWSQDGRQRVVAVLDFVDFSTGSGAGVELGPVFANSLSLVLGQSNFKVLDRKELLAAYAKEGFDSSTALDRDKIIAFASAHGADVVVTGFYSNEGDSINAGIRAYDILSGRLAVSDLQEGETGLAVFDTIDSMAANVSAKMRESLPPLTAAEVVVRQEKVTVQTTVVEQVKELGNTVTITLLSPNENAEVFDGDRDLGKIKDGRLDVQVKEGTSSVIKQVMEGWYDSVDTIQKTEAGNSYQLSPIFKKTVVELALATFLEAPVGMTLEAKYYFIPDWVFAGLDIGLYSISPWGIPPDGFDSLKEMRITLVGGSYIIPEKVPVRFAPYVGIAGDLFLVDPIVGVVGLTFGGRLEFNFATGKIFMDIRGPIVGTFASSFGTLQDHSLGWGFFFGYGIKL